MPASTSYSKRNVSLAVLVPELIGAPMVTVGAVYCMQKIPKQMDWLSNVFAKHIVEPHLEGFEYFAKGLRRAHEDYDEKRNAERAREGKPPLPNLPETRKQRAFAIADGVVKTFLALGADLAATYCMQNVMRKWLKADISAGKTAMTETTVQIGAMALMPTVFARQSENISYGMARKFQHVLGTPKKEAEERARALTYVSLPGIIGAGASLLSAHSQASNGAAKVR